MGPKCNCVWTNSQKLNIIGLFSEPANISVSSYIYKVFSWIRGLILLLVGSPELPLLGKAQFFKE